MFLVTHLNPRADSSGVSEFDFFVAGMKGALATRVSGSADLYHKHNRKPYHSINFVVAHDGFSLYDLVRRRREGSTLYWHCTVNQALAAGQLAMPVL